MRANPATAPHRQRSLTGEDQCPDADAAGHGSAGGYTLSADRRSFVTAAIDEADLTMLPKTTVEIADESAAKKLLRLVDALEENDDVQDVYANFDIPEQVLEAVAG